MALAKKGDVYVDIHTRTKEGIASLAKYAAAVTAAYIVVKKVIGAVGDLVKAYGVQEQAERKLASAIRATGHESDISTDRLQALASQLQNVTIYGDEVTLSAMAMLQQLANLNEEGLAQITPAMLDFASAMGVDLDTAAALLGKTLGSTTNALSRYGIVIDATASPTEKLAQLTSELEKKFGGMSEELANTTIGILKQTRNTWGDVFEKMGKALVTFYEPAIEALNNVGKSILGVSDATNELADAVKNLDNASGGSATERYLTDIMQLSADARNVTEGVNSITRAFKYLTAEGTDVAQKWKAVATVFAMDVLGTFDDLSADGEIDAAMKQLEIMRNVLRDVVKLPPDDLGVLQEYINKIWALYNALTNVGKQTTYNAAAMAKFNEQQLQHIELMDMTFEQYAKIDKQLVEPVDKAKTAWENLIETMGKIGGTGIEDVFGAIGASFVDIERGAEMGKDAFKDMFSSALQALGKYLLGLAAEYGVMVLAGDLTKIPATGAAGAGAAASFAAAGAVQALGTGGIVTRPTLAVVGERGPEAVVPLSRGMGTVVHIHAGMLIRERETERMLSYYLGR